MAAAADAQTVPGANKQDYWCGGSVLSGTASSGSRFSVKVSTFVSTDLYGQFHDELPVGAAKIVLLPDTKMDRALSAMTDAWGIAMFSNVPSGQYTIHIDGARFGESQASLTVDAQNGTPTAVNLLWPQRGYAVKHVQGTLMDAFTGMRSSAELNYEPRPFIGAGVQLLDLTSGAQIAHTRTDDKGYYEFPSVGPGLYLVRFNGNSESPSFNMAVEVGQAAVLEHLPVLVAQKHDCGPGLVIY